MTYLLARPVLRRDDARGGFLGEALVALALGQAPEAYRRDPASYTGAAALNTFLANPPAPPRLHDRLALLWASTSALSLIWHSRSDLIAETFARQQSDGGWTTESLGPWMAHPDAPSAAGSHAYATAYTAFVLQGALVPPSHPGLAKAIGWLRAHQDPTTGAWPAVSMNKRYPEGSMMSLFMQDAATAFASMVLVEADAARTR
jgi:hypothetical protein